MRRRRPSRSRRRRRRPQEGRASRVGAAGSRVPERPSQEPSSRTRPPAPDDTSPISRTRCLRSFCRQRAQHRDRRAQAPSAGSAVQSGSFMQDARERVGDVLALERAPAREHFVEHGAERPDVGCACRRSCPCACSGLMYAAVPRIIPACVIAGVVMRRRHRHARRRTARRAPSPSRGRSRAPSPCRRRGP